MTAVLSPPDRRGFRGRGSGRMSYLQVPQEHRGSSKHVCGLTPWAVGTSVPTVGAHVGEIIKVHGAGSPLGCDPINWFDPRRRIRLISNPSVSLLGIPGIGKSTLIRRWVLWYSMTGIVSLIPADLKPDYVNTIRAIDGQVIRLGRGRDGVNILDIQDAVKASKRLSRAAGVALLANAKARRQNALEALLAIQRSSALADFEETILNESLRILDARFSRRRQPAYLLQDVKALIEEGPVELRDVSLDGGDDGEYRRTVKPLLRTLTAATQVGGLGDIFNKHTTIRMRIDKSAVIDVSSIDAEDEKLKAAVLFSCWSYTFGLIAISHALADEGLEPKRNYFVPMDEQWDMLRTAPGLVDRVDALSRLNRNEGLGTANINHFPSDSKALKTVEDQVKANGNLGRSGMIILGGLPPEEVELLRATISISDAEANMLTSWSTPASWSAEGDELPPGNGNFMVKIGQRPGLPFHLSLFPCELKINNTNHMWEDK